MRLLAIALGVLWLLMPPGFWSFYPPYPSDSERFGVGLAGPAEEISRYDVTQLQAGWYTNWGAALHPPHPGGMEYVQTIRLSGSSYHPDMEAISEIASANPGSVWLIGNEPDCIWQDSSTPAQYAVVYHDLYTFIKGQDPSAKVAIGGVVQGTPLRLQYLDMVLEEYRTRYGGMIPVDVWNVHGFILREEASSWGCEIPPGLQDYAYLGRKYRVQDNDDIKLFKEHIVSFRQWMKDRGEQDKPLIVSEYGVLMPVIHGFDYARVRDFMLATFDFFQGVDPDGVDADLGYPEDGYRLVQAWAWYSLDDDVYDDDGTWLGGGYNGDLYEGGLSKQLTPLGQDFGDYIGDSGLVTEYVDLYPAGLSFQPLEPIYGQPVAVTITAQVANYGNVTATAPIDVGLWNGDPTGGGALIGVVSTTSTVPPRYSGVAPVSVSWQTIATGTQRVTAQVDPGQGVVEPREDNNLGFGDLSFYVDWVISGAGPGERVPIFAGEVITLPLRAEIGNEGTVAGQGVRVQFSEEGGGVIGEVTLDSPQAPGDSSPVQVLWPVRRAGLYRIHVVVDPSDAFPEPDESDNEASATILVPSQVVLLPLLSRMSP